MNYFSYRRGAALAAGLMLAVSARAQTHFSIGPSAGITVSTAPYRSASYTYHTTWSTGAEGGVLAVASREHMGLQMALLLSQKGFGIADERHSDDGRGNTSNIYLNARYRLNYLTLPLNVVYTLRADGQGFQVFAGGYLGMLLGGDYDRQDSYSYTFPGSTQGGSSTFPGGIRGGSSTAAGPVAAGDYSPASSNGYPDRSFYSRRFDVGMQGGLGYRLGRALLQVAYSQGLRNLAADKEYGFGASPQIMTTDLTYRNRMVQASLSYFLLSRH
jgi:hypothetical protein